VSSRKVKPISGLYGERNRRCYAKASPKAWTSIESQLLGFNPCETVSVVRSTAEGLDINKKSIRFSPLESSNLKVIYKVPPEGSPFKSQQTIISTYRFVTIL